tara:strand:+ start:11373 stop:11576 length:204 start_codon:yes stop_codon:yes gene_type:complete
MRLMSIQQFRKTSDVFEPGSMPSENTLRAWIDDGEIPGKRIGRKYYIDMSALEDEESALIASVLAAS